MRGGSGHGNKKPSHGLALDRFELSNSLPRIKMASPVSLGDLVIAGQFACKIWEACRDAGAEYDDLAQLCSEIHLTIDLCRPNERTSVLRQQESETIEVLASGIKTTLTRLEKILGSYSGINETGVRSFRGRISFSFFTKSDRDDITKSLQQKLQLLTAVLQGSSLNLQNVAVSLLLELVVEKRKAGDKRLDDEAIKTNSTVVAGLIEDLGIISEHTKEKLLKDRKIGEKIIRAEIDKDESAEGLAKPESPVKLLEHSGYFNAPTATKTDKFDPPKVLHWFGKIENLFTLVTVSDAFSQLTTVWPPPNPPPIRYSQQDEWLCPFQEGWTLNRTSAERLGISEQAFYFSYNSLSCQPDRKPMTSRLYFQLYPLIPVSGNDNMPFQRDEKTGLIDMARKEFYAKSISRFQRTYSLAQNHQQYGQPQGYQAHGYPLPHTTQIQQPAPLQYNSPSFGYQVPQLQVFQPPPTTTYYMGYVFTCFMGILH